MQLCFKITLILELKDHFLKNFSIFYGNYMYVKLSIQILLKKLLARSV